MEDDSHDNIENVNLGNVLGAHLGSAQMLDSLLDWDWEEMLVQRLDFSSDLGSVEK